MTKTTKKVEEIQDELKILKNEIKETLVDLREHLLTYAENPFVSAAPPGGSGAPAVSAALPPLPLPPEPPSPEPPPAEPPPPVAETPAAPPPESAAPSAPPPAEPPGELAAGKPAPAAEAAMEPPKPASGHQPPGPMPPEAGAAAGSRPGALRRQHRDADLLTLATLSSWLEEHLHALGAQRTRAVVEIYASMGGMSEELKSILLRLIDLEERPGPASVVPMREYLRIVAELDNILWRNQMDRTGAALVAVLTASPRPPMGKHDGNGIRQAA